MKRLFLSIFILAVLALPVGAMATTRYVDNTTTSCSTPADTDYDPVTKTCGGGGASPVYSTFTAAEAACAQYDIVIARAGTYNERFEINVANTTWQAYSEETPVIDNNETIVGPYTALVQVKGVSGVTWDGITIRESAGRLLALNDADNFTCRNTLFEEAWDNCVVVELGSDNALFENCEFTKGSKDYLMRYWSTTTWHATVSVLGSAGTVIRGCKIHSSYFEGIDIIKAATGSIIEYCEIYGNYRLQVYLSNSKDAIVRYNLIYGTGSSVGTGIWIGGENGWAETHPGYNTGHKVYGNLVANTANNLRVSGESPYAINYNSTVTNNTFVESSSTDNGNVGYIWDCGTGHVFKNNIIQQTSGTIAVIKAGSVTGGYNLWSQAQASVDNDIEGTGDVYSGDAALSKTTGWNSLTDGILTGAEFAIGGASQAKDAGTPLADGKWLLSSNVNFLTNQFSIYDQAVYGSYEIGGMIYLTGDDADGDGISDSTETDAGTNPALATDNDTEAEKVATIVAASDASADGYPTITDLENTGLTGLITVSLSLYEAAIQAGADGTPTLAELQAIIDSINSASVNDTSADGDCLAHYPLDTNANDDQGGMALTFNNSAAIASGWLDLENYSTDQDQDAILAIADQPATAWWRPAQSGIGGGCAVIQPESLTEGVNKRIMGPLDFANGKHVWSVAVNENNYVFAEIGYDSGATSQKVYHGTQLIAGNKYGVCMFYNSTDDDLWLSVRNGDGSIHGSDVYNSDVLPVGATFNQEDSDFYVGCASNNGGSFDGKIKEVAIWNGIDGSDFVAQYVTDWTLGNYDRVTAVACAETYAPSVTADLSVEVGSYPLQDFVGFIYTPATGECVCAVDARVGSKAGTPPNQHLRIFSLDGSNQATASLGTSAALTGSSFSTNTFTSANAGLYSFSTCVQLTGGTAYGFGFFADSDGNLNDDPEVDDANDWSLGFENGNNVDVIQGGHFRWTWAADYPYAVQGSDLDDDAVVKIHTETVGDTPPTAVTLGAPGLITTPDGACIYAANTTVSWTDSTARYIGVPVSGALTVTGLQGWPALPLLAGPATADVTYANYYGQCVDAEAQRYMVFRYTPDAGDQTAGLAMSSATIDCDQDNDGNNDASAVDTNDFDMCSAENNTVTSDDPSGTGTITISIPFDTNNKLTIGTFSGTDPDTLLDYEYQGTYLTPAAAEAAGVTPAAGSHLFIDTLSGVLNAWFAGTALAPITITLADSSTVATGAWTLDEDYWTAVGSGGSQVGGIRVTGAGVEIQDLVIDGGLSGGKATRCKITP